MGKFAVVSIFIVLLVVVAVVAGWYWFYSAKVIPEQEALRQLHIALEHYFLDHWQYPQAMNDKAGPAEEGELPITFGGAPDSLLPAKRIPGSVLEKAKETLYASDRQNFWLLLHPGPDGLTEVDLQSWVKDATGDMELYLQLHPDSLVDYDPTNGVTSRGDYYRIGP